MSEINLQLVREYFELHRFHVLTHWEQVRDMAPAAGGAVEPAPRLFIEHANPTPGLPSFLLRENEVTALERAVVEVRAWHADRVYASVIEQNPVLGQVASAECRSLAEGVFGTPEFHTVLVIAELPASPAARSRSLELLEGLGIDHVLEFSVVLRGLLDMVHPQGQYAPSATLQTLRLLKRYDLIRRQQLELAFPFDPTPPPRVPLVETTPVDESEAGDETAPL